MSIEPVGKWDSSSCSNRLRGNPKGEFKGSLVDARYRIMHELAAPVFI